MNWAGALLFVASAYFFGIQLARDEGKRLKSLDSLILLFEFLQRRMGIERTPLYDLFADFEDDYLESTGFLPTMRTSRRHITDLWKDSISLLPLDSDTERELLHFGDSLGFLPLEEQLKRLSAVVDVLKNARTELRSSLPAKQKSIKTVSLLFGMLAAIILM